MIERRRSKKNFFFPNSFKFCAVKRNYQFLSGNNNRLKLFIIEEAKEGISDFSKVTVKVFLMCSTILFCFNIISI